jgi:hypothetical protein
LRTMNCSAKLKSGKPREAQISKVNSRLLLLKDLGQECFLDLVSAGTDRHLTLCITTTTRNLAKMLLSQTLGLKSKGRIKMRWKKYFRCQRTTIGCSS